MAVAAASAGEEAVTMMSRRWPEPGVNDGRGEWLNAVNGVACTFKGVSFPFLLVNYDCTITSILVELHIFVHYFLIVCFRTITSYAFLPEESR